MEIIGDVLSKVLEMEEFSNFESVNVVQGFGLRMSVVRFLD